MRDRHFKELLPICPACRQLGRGDRRLRVALVERQSQERLLDGLLQCSDATCATEYPVVAGLPVLVPGLRAFLRDTSLYLMLRDDLEPAILSLLAEASGPGSALESIFQQMSTYGADHWGEIEAGYTPGSAQRCLEHGLSFVRGRLPDGPVLDAGCAAGGTSVALAEALGRTVLGIDVNPMLLGIGRRILERGEVRYPLRRIGLLYDVRTRTYRPAGADLVDFWSCNLAGLPFQDATFALISALNILDCLPNPADGASEMRRVLTSGGVGIVACPFDWSGAVTPPEHWVGGHSGRPADRGDPAALLQPLLSGQLGGHAAPRSITVLGHEARYPWRVRLHERATVEYATCVLSFRVGESA